MQRIKLLQKKNLIKITYLLIATLFITSLVTIISTESPERMIQGTWREKEWYIEKGESDTSRITAESGLRNEILKNLEPLHYGIWDFQEDRLVSFTSTSTGESLEWLIKGRGHILELRRAGKQIETFQIQRINDNLLELHLNFDLQVKGIMKIVLERVTSTEKYATKIQYPSNK